MEKEYNHRLKKIEEAIDIVLPQTTTHSWVQQNIGSEKVNNTLEDYQRIIEPGLDLIQRGGKRWRPVLMVIIAQLFGKKMEDVVPLTPLVEIPHNGSLIIDDIEDKADWRRGKEAVHLIYGDDMAINTGNLLYFLPTWIIDQTSIPKNQKLLVYEYYTSAMRRLHFGQGLDIQWHRDHKHYPTEKEYLQMCRFKTGSLSRLAMELGGLLGKGTDFQIKELGKVGEELGVGFQIMDDIKNLRTGNPGKKRGDDIVEGKKSLPVIYFVKEHPEKKDELRNLFLIAREMGIDKGNNAIEEAIKLMEDSHAIDKAEGSARSLLKKSRNYFVNNYEESEPLSIITQMLDQFIT
jgi:octaprenyl-diphosphate synthase